MRRISGRHRLLLTGLVVLAVMTAGFFIQRWISDHAFDRLEASQVSQDAQRLRIAVAYEIRLLSVFGATNSVWDNTYTDVDQADQEAFAVDFAPKELAEAQSIDGAFGIGSDGDLRVGGLVADGGYTRPPADIADPAVLGRLFDRAGEPGVPTCGVLGSSAAPYLFCGFAVYHSDSSGPPAGGLVVVKALNQQRLDSLGDQLNLPMRLVTRQRPGTSAWRTLAGASNGLPIGDIEVATVLASADRIALDVRIPATIGSPVTIECVRDRPINRASDEVAMKMFMLSCGLGMLMLFLVVVLIQRGVRQQVYPLRQTTQAIIASGDRRLRIGSPEGESDIGALAWTIDSMLDTMAEQDASLREEQAARERQFRATNAKQRLAEQQVRRRAQAVVDETATVVIGELQDVVAQVEAVRVATATIDERVHAAGEVTRTVVATTRQVDEVVGALGESLRRVGGIAQVIGGVAAKTNLLALNATIEAVRAGPAGRSFSIVAREVKELARATAQSTGEISETIQSLERDAASITAAITGMADGVGGIDDATTAASAVANRQNAMVAELDRCVQESIGRIETLAKFTERLDRRAAERVAATGNATVRIGSAVHVAQVIDISEGGLRCVVDDDVPLREGVRAEFEVPLGDDSAMLHGVVIRTAPSDEGNAVEAGLRFVEPTEHVSAKLRDYVTRIIATTER